MARGRYIYNIRTEAIVGRWKRKGSTEFLPVVLKYGKSGRQIYQQGEKVKSSANYGEVAVIYTQ